MKRATNSTIFERLVDERKEKHWTQKKMAEIGGVSLRTQKSYEAGDRKPDAAYLTAIAHLGRADVQYIICGVGSTNLDEIGELTDEEKAARRDRMTKKVMKIAEGCTRQPDPLKLGPVRDLALSAHLRDDQIKVIFDLLEQAGKPDFWLGTENKKGEKGK